MSEFQDVKVWLSLHTGLGRDALHIYVALVLFFGSMLLFGWRAGQWRPVLLVLVAALAGEAWDIVITANHFGDILWAESRKDVCNTLAWPLFITLLARFTPVLRMS